MLGAGVVGIALIAAAGCNSTSSSGSSSGKCGHEIDFFGALTGPSRNLGINIEHGVELAIDQFNAKNGKGCITVKKSDSQGSPDKAPAQARNVASDDKVIAVVGPAFSGESQVADPIINAAGIPMITPSATNPSLSEKSWKYFHRGLANDNQQGSGDAAFIKDVLKAKKVFVVDDQQDYSVGLANVIKSKLGNLVVNTDKVAPEGQQTDFSATVTKIKASGADVLFYAGYYGQAGLLRKQLTGAGWTGTMVSGDGSNDPGFVQSAGVAAANGTYLSMPSLPVTKSSGTFLTDYKKKWGADAGIYSDTAYDATNFILQGISKGNTTRDKLNAYLNKTAYKGVSNTYKFTSTGELDSRYLKVWLWKVTDGKIEPYQAAPGS